MERSMPWKIVSLTVLAASIQACGGGGGGGNHPASQNLGSGAGKSLEQLNQDYKALREAAYKGVTTPATLSADNIVPFARAIMSDEFPQAAKSTAKTRKAMQGSRQKLSLESVIARQRSAAAPAEKTSREKIDETDPCDNTDGSTRATGNIDDYGNGALDIVYKNCVNNGIIIDGAAVAYIQSGYPSAFFYNGTRMTFNDQAVLMTGSIDDSGGNGSVTNMLWQNATTGYQYQELNYQENNYSDGNYDNSNFSGTILLPEYGAVNAAGNYTIYPATELGEGSFSLSSGNLTAQIILTSNIHEASVKLSDSSDAGATKQAFTDIGNFLHSDRESRLNFVPWIDPKNPPTYSNIRFTSYFNTTTTPITAVIDGISDLDGDNVTATFYWSINNIPVDDIQSDTLPTGRAHGGDYVTVYAELSDGFNKIATYQAQTSIEDSAGSLTAVDLPSELKIGDAMSVKVSFVDPDQPDTSFPVTLIYGPKGASVDSSGVLHWTASDLLFGKSQDFHFGFKLNGTGDHVGDIVVKVVDENGLEPIVRSGFQVPYINNAIELIKFGNDTYNSILVSDSNALIYTVKKKGDEYVQDWLYPYHLGGTEKLVQAHATDLNRDGKNEIMAATTTKVYFIESKNSLATQIFSVGSSSIKSFLVADLDRDGNDEAVLLLKNNDDNGNEINSLQIIDAKIGESRGLISLPSDTATFAIGNVDNDPALEIITSSGLIYDGASLINAWYFSSGFGTNVATGDVDGDGIDEILGTKSWTGVSLFSAVTKSTLWTMDNSSTCSVAFANTDADAAKELIMGDCQFGHVTIYDATKSDFTVKTQLNTIELGALSVAAGDVDNDGITEVIWSAGQSHTGEDILAVGEIDGSGTVWNSNQLDWFVGLGFTQIAPGDKRAVFLAPRTESGYSGQELVLMSESGELQTSKVLSDNAEGGDSGVVLDYNGDGYAEALIASSRYYDSYAQVIKLSDFSQLWSSAQSSDSGAMTTVLTADINSDGHDDALYVSNGKIVINDLYSETLLHVIDTGASYIYDVTVLDKNNAPSLIVASNQGLSLWSKDSHGTYLNVVSNSTLCKRIAAGKIGASGNLQIACVDAEYYSSNEDRLITFDANLNQQDTFTLSGTVGDLNVVTFGDGTEKLFISQNVGDSYYRGAGTAVLGEFSTTGGGFIWTSSNLLGIVPKHSLHSYVDENAKVHMVFATDNAMYLSR